MMLKCFKNFDAKKTGLFAAGVLFGTAGIKILSSKDAKKLYTNCTAAVLRAKEVVLKTATKVQENAEDIYAEAKQINEDRAAKEEEVFDGEEVTEETTARDRNYRRDSRGIKTHERDVTLYVTSLLSKAGYRYEISNQT